MGIIARAGRSAGLMALCVGACSAPPAPPVAPYKTVLIAGDDSLPVFDNAAAAFADALVARNLTAPSAIVRFPAAHGTGGASAALTPILRSIGTMQPAPGQGCLVFATSHGVRNQGIYLSAGPAFLAPADLDFALTLGCHNAPTVVIISACFSGQFVRPPMPAPNRIILTASRADRSSFGCGAGRDFTVFDRCLLAGMETASGWRQLFVQASDCVAQEERREHVRPSQPQFSAGAETQPDAFPLPRA